MSDEEFEIEKIYVLKEGVEWDFKGEINGTQIDLSKLNKEYFGQTDSNFASTFELVDEKLKIQILKEKHNNYLDQNVKILTLTKEKLKNVLNCVGYKFNLSNRFANEVFSEFAELVVEKYHLVDKEALGNIVVTKSNATSSIKSELRKYSMCSNIKSESSQSIIEILKETKLKKQLLICTNDCFFFILRYFIYKEFKKIGHIKRYFYLSYMVLEKIIPVIILLGGTSGTGKSTLSALIAEQFNISNVISTDHIRHIMRNFKSKEEMPILFTSTYDSWKALKLPENQLNDLSENQKIIKGYKEQSKIVINQMENVVDQLISRNESVIIEGVHITTKFVFNLCNKYKYVLPYFIYIGNANKHKERFAVRSKNMTLKVTDNKYIQNFDHIRIIQQYILVNAENCRIPGVDNNNVDKSLCVLQQSILRGLYKQYKGELLFDKHANNMYAFYSIFKKIIDKLNLTKPTVYSQFRLEKDKEKQSNISTKEILNYEGYENKHPQKENNIRKVDYLSDGEDFKKGKYKTKNDSIQTKTRREQKVVSKEMLSSRDEKAKQFYSQNRNFRDYSNSEIRDGSLGYKSHESAEDQEVNVIHETDDDYDLD